MDEKTIGCHVEKKKRSFLPSFRPNERKLLLLEYYCGWVEKSDGFSFSPSGYVVQQIRIAGYQTSSSTNFVVVDIKFSKELRSTHVCTHPIEVDEKSKGTQSEAKNNPSCSKRTNLTNKLKTRHNNLELLLSLFSLLLNESRGVGQPNF